MESTATRSEIGVDGHNARPGLALVLALLSVPGSTLAWSVWEDGGGFVIGVPLAIAAVVLGVQARQRSAEGAGMATAAIVIAGLMLAMTAIWTAVEYLA
jgi:hypothetical protein